MTQSLSHKTVLVLDRGPYFLSSSGESVELDTAGRRSGKMPLPPVTKTLWTCNVEAVLEYCRISFDIFPDEKVVHLIASDTNATLINSWEEQNLVQISTCLAQLGPPSRLVPPDDCNVLHGLLQAVSSLCEPSALQKQLHRNGFTQQKNKGRIVCVTHCTTDSVAQLELAVADEMERLRAMTSSTGTGGDGLIALDECELVLVHVRPSTDDVTDVSSRVVNSRLRSELHTSLSGRTLALKMIQLAVRFLQLSSTAVTGIPMKEEQNANSSANYDVELLHPDEVHEELRKAGSQEGLQASREGLYMDTVSLKWCTPKSNVVEFHLCSGAFRICPVDVNSRPSACLTNFLLSGRAVMLEQPRRGGTAKAITHMLASHGGEIFMHVLTGGRSTLDDAPSISEGVGGRVTDYRINELSELIKRNRLAPLPYGSEDLASGVQRSMSQLERHTRYWPLVQSETIIFNMVSDVEPLLNLIVKEKLDDDELLKCRKVVYRLVELEVNGEPLPLPSGGHGKVKGHRKDEQYKQLWAEVERLVRAHASTSDAHQEVLDCLLGCKRSSPSPAPASVPNAPPSPDPASVSQGKRKRDIKQEPDVTSSAHKRFRPDAPSIFGKSGKPQSLLSLWTGRMKTLCASRTNVFCGRLDMVDNKTELYKDLDKDEDNQDKKMLFSKGFIKQHPKREKI